MTNLKNTSPFAWPMSIQDHNKRKRGAAVANYVRRGLTR